MPKSQTHELKSDPEVFVETWAGRKTFELRLDDRGYAVGDTLVLRETAHSAAQMAGGAPLGYTGRRCTARITHLLRGPRRGLAEGWCILSHSAVERHEGQADTPEAS